MIKQLDLDKVVDAANIVDVVSDFISLKRAGANFKGLCPFHEDKNPSLSVSPARNYFKCFVCGEGGGPISFVMKHEGASFPEAVKYLAKKYGIKLDESAPTAKEREEYMLKESMFIANDEMSKVFQKQLLLNKEAQDYAYSRWGKEYCEEVGVGYCPRNEHLVQKAGIKTEIAKELKLVNDYGNDFFSGRIIIPIRDRQRRILGFTARIFEEPKNKKPKEGEKNKEPPKYINSAYSLIYNKSASIFGIDTAWREAAKTQRFYLVEGAPDCMRLHILGVYNTMAPLGTAWTQEHFALMKQVANHLCFLPDADPPKPDGDFGPGINAVMKSGKMAIKMGFSVTVKEIPLTKKQIKEQKKEDPDSYCTTIEKFQKLKEVDFILWLANKTYKKNATTVQQKAYIDDIASLLAVMDDDVTVDMYIRELAKKAGTLPLWKKAIGKIRENTSEQEEKKKVEMESEMFKQFGFYIDEHKFYFSISDKGGTYTWSNFIMTPLFHIKDTMNPKRIFLLENVFGSKELIEIKQEDLVSLSKFKQRVEGLGNYIWKASERELTKLKGFLYEKTETAVMIVQLGWKRQGFFAFGNGIFYKGKFLKVDDYGIVRIEGIGNFYLPANSKIYRDDSKLFQFERLFVHLGQSNITLREFTDQIFCVFGDNGRVGFLFLLATLFRDIVTRTTRSFPILNLFGPKGSGKSELGHTLMSFFIIENVPPNIQNSTLPALNDTVAAVANALVHIDEFKNCLDVNKNEFLKGLWDGTGRTRMNMDLDKKKETTAVDSGVILSGQEMPTADIALFSRLIFLSFSSSIFTDDEKRNFMELKRMRMQGMTHLTLELLNLRRYIEADYPAVYQRTMSEVSDLLRDVHIEDRIMLNWVAPLAAFRTLEAYLDTSLSYKKMLTVCSMGIKFQNAQCRQNNELAAFWNMVQYLVSEGEIIENGDYRIEYLRHLKTNNDFEYEWNETIPVLFIQKSRIFMLYKKFGRLVGDTLLPEGSLKYYLTHSREYLGEKASVKYTVYHKGLVQYQKEGNTTKEAKTVQRSYCFNLKLLAERYNINLEQENSHNRQDSDDEDDEKQEQKNNEPKQEEFNFK